MVVFFDIDGTIVDEATQILPQSAVDAVAELVRRGHQAIVNTGRPFGHIDPRVRAMAFTGYVCGCGMERILDGKVVSRAMPEESLCRYVRDSVRECGMQVLYEGETELYSDGRWSLGAAAVREAARMHKKGFATREIDSLPHCRFMKFVTHDAPGCRREEMLRRMQPYFSCIDRDNSMVEYVLKGYSKAGGAAALLAELGCPRSQVYAIGDSANDLPMFAQAAHTAALGDGMAQLKAQAEYVTAPVLQDGVAQALRHWGLIGA
ncbi:MAG TPA: HAD hydrolase family protein [Candidatus Faecousia intestinigallinarum]|nr:HAD hydrolase family protein [Candidatus Faecousia intestinigallinarum]